MKTNIDKRFNEKVHILTLKNGMQVHLLPKSDPYFSTYVELSIPFGSNHLKYIENGHTVTYPLGSAHFMEHKIFAMEDGDAFVKFSKLGIDANAMTSYWQTSYLFTATNHVLQGLKLLLDMIDYTYFTKENIMAEEKIIAEELKMYQDDIEQEIYNDLMENMYIHHPFKYDIGGTLNSIKKIDKETLNDIHKHFYHPSQRLLVIAGKFDLEEITKFFNDYDKTLDVYHTDVIIPKEPLNINKKETVKEKDISISKLALGYKLPFNHEMGDLHLKEELTYTLLFNLLLGKTSHLYYELLDQKIINQNFYTQTTFGKNIGHLMIYGDTKDPKILKDILVEKLNDDPSKLFNEETFKKHVKNYIGHFIFALNQVEYKAYLYAKYFHKGVHLYDVIDIIQSISFDELCKAYETFKKSAYSYVIYKKAN